MDTERTNQNNPSAHGRTEYLLARVRGRVQNVGYRVFVMGAARELAVTGSVRNMPDGAVEVRAYGSRPALEALLERLKQGPTAARVSQVSTEWATAESASVPEDFRVRQ